MVIEWLTPAAHMAAKQWAPSHIGAVASEWTDLRIGGAVKQMLSDHLLNLLDELVEQLEDETLEADPERKTLDDPHRTRLKYSRTRDLMVERIKKVESVGSAAVQRAVEELEWNLQNIMKRATIIAEDDGRGTIKERHLEAALGGETTDIENKGESVNSATTDLLSEALQEVGYTHLSPALVMQLAKRFAGMSIEMEAMEELVHYHYMKLDELTRALDETLHGGNFPMVQKRMDEMQEHIFLGYLKRALGEAGGRARASGRSKVATQDVIDL